MIADPKLLLAIAALVNFLKSFDKIPPKALILVSAVLGLTGYILQAKLPDADFQLVLNGLIAGLAVSGFYDLGDAAVKAYKARR